MKMRFAEENDAPELLAIYAQYMDSAVTFEYELPTVEDFVGRMTGIFEEYPYIVCTEDNLITGYAYAHRFQERAAYQWNAELSVYVDSTCHSRGLGTVLYSALIEILKAQGVRTVYGIVTSPNPKSERLHERLGFELVGTLHSTGCKDGMWHDVNMFVKKIGDYDKDPVPIRKVSELSGECAAIMAKYR